MSCHTTSPLTTWRAGPISSTVPPGCTPLRTSQNITTSGCTAWRYETPQPGIISSILASPHRTLDPAVADFFLVPIYGGCITIRGDDSPRVEMHRRMKGLRSHFTAQYYQQALGFISTEHPFWNRTGGRDHLWTWAWDEGACWAPQSMWGSIMVSHWGNTMSRHTHSTTAYGSDNWDHMPRDLRGTHPCFDPSKDIVMPAFKPPSPGFLPSNLRTLESRKYLFYFNGKLGSAFPGGRPEPQYSMGIRQAVAKFFASGTAPGEPLGEKSSPDVVVTSARTDDYGLELGSSMFCGVFPGDGFSARMEDSVLHGCIPVIIQDGVQLPFENFLNYSAFTVRVAEEDIPYMVDILRAIPKERVREMLERVRGVASRWYYRSFVALEAELQRKQGRDVSAETKATLDVLDGDDAIDTLFQILGYKLQQQSWRDKKEGLCA